MKNFNREKFLALLQEYEEFEKFKKENNLSSDFDNIKFKTIVYYQILLKDHFYWTSKNEYFKIFQNFSNGDINGETLVKQLNTLRRNNRIKCEIQESNLKNDIHFQPNPQSQGFTTIVSDIVNMIDLFDPDLDGFREDIYAISEKSLKRLVDDYFIPEIYKYCKKT